MFQSSYDAWHVSAGSSWEVALSSYDVFHVSVQSSWLVVQKKTTRLKVFCLEKFFYQAFSFTTYSPCNLLKSYNMLRNW